MDFTHISVYFELLAAAAAGALAVFGVFNTTMRARRREDDQTASNLIQNLKTTTELQDKEITRLRDKETQQGKEIAHLQGQLKVLTEIMQGRDPQMQQFLKSAPELIEIARENNGLAKEQSKAMTELTTSIAALVAAITPKPPAVTS